MKAHPAVYDCVVTGRRAVGGATRSSPSFGPPAGVQVDARRSRAPPSPVARYKLPKAIVFVDTSSARRPARPTTGGRGELRLVARQGSTAAVTPLAAGGGGALEPRDPARGRRQARGGAGHVRRHRPRYDLVNRMMTFRLDVRWRRRAVGRSASPRASRCSTWPAAPATSASTSPRRSPADLDRSQLRMLRADRSGAPGPGRHPSPTRCRTAAVDGVTCGFALRNLVDLDAFFAELGRVLRPGGRDRPARRRRAPGTDGALGPRRLLRQRRAPDRGLLSDPAAYRYLPRSVAYLPPSGELVAMLSGPGSPTPSRHLSGGITAHLATETRDPLMRAVTRRRRPPTRSTSRRRPGRRRPVRPRRRRRRRPRRRGRVDVDEAAGVPGHRSSTSTDPGEATGRGPVAVGWVPFSPVGPAN